MTATGLAMNIPAVEARKALTVAYGISVSNGDEATFERLVSAATGDPKMGFKARVSLQHQKAVRS